MRGDLYIGKGTSVWDWQNGKPSTLEADSVEGTNATGSVRSTNGVTFDVRPAEENAYVKLRQNGARGQFNEKTCIRIYVTSTKDSITIVSVANYHNYTVAGNAATSDTTQYTPTAEDVTRGYVDVVSTGQTFLYSISVDNWTDTWEAWGVGLEDGALDALMTFRPNKEPITNKNVTAQGAVVVCGAGLVDERTVSVPIHIVARNKQDFLSKREAFYEAIQEGKIVLRVEKPVQVSYEMYYVSCSQYTQFMIGVAKFILSLYEPNTPAI